MLNQWCTAVVPDQRPDYIISSVDAYGNRFYLRELTFTPEGRLHVTWQTSLIEFAGRFTMREVIAWRNTRWIKDLELIDVGGK